MTTQMQVLLPPPTVWKQPQGSPRQIDDDVNTRFFNYPFVPFSTHRIGGYGVVVVSVFFNACF